MALSNAWLLSETIDKHAKGIQVVSWHLLLAGGPRIVKRFFAISVLVVISKPKKEKQESTRSNLCTYVMVTAKPKPVLPEKLVDRHPGPFGH